MNLGYKLRELRIKQHLTQKDVVGDYMTRNMLSKIENGSATPSVKTLEYLADALGHPVSYFVSESNELPAPPLDTQQLEAIVTLTNLLPQEPDSLTQAIALCIQAHTALVSGNAPQGLSLLTGHDIARFPPAGQIQIYLALEACYKAMDDYKQAYHCACLRHSLS